MQLSLTELEAILVCKICRAYDHSIKNCFQRHKRPKTITLRTYEAEAKPAPKKTYCDMKYYKCGVNHRLADCPRASKEEIKRIYTGRKTQYQKSSPSKSLPSRYMNEQQQSANTASHNPPPTAPQEPKNPSSAPTAPKKANWHLAKARERNRVQR